MNTLNFRPELTAMNVKRESESARYLLALTEEKSSPKILDYGCGLGRNMSFILNHSEAAAVDGCDTADQVENLKKDNEKSKYFMRKNCIITTSNNLTKTYDFILSSHVLNVVLDDVKQIILNDMYKLLSVGGSAVIQVRTRKDVESSKTKVPFSTGWMIKKGKHTTFQEAISKEKMEALVCAAGFKIKKHIFNSSIHLLEVTK